MALSKNINAFTHVQPVLDEAVAQGEIFYTLANAKAAFRWRVEAYHYRKLLSAHGPTPYDRLVLRVVGNQVRISPNIIAGTITNARNEIIPLTAQVEVFDPLLEEARALALEIDQGKP